MENYQFNDLKWHSGGEFDEWREEYKRTNGYHFNVKKSKSVFAAQKDTTSVLSEELTYFTLDWYCEQAGEPRQMRRANNRAPRNSCQAFFKFRTSTDKKFLFIKDFQEMHNHDRYQYGAAKYRPEGQNHENASEVHDDEIVVQEVEIENNGDALGGRGDEIVNPEVEVQRDEDAPGVRGDGIVDPEVKDQNHEDALEVPSDELVEPEVEEKMENEAAPAAVTPQVATFEEIVQNKNSQISLQSQQIQSPNVSILASNEETLKDYHPEEQLSGVVQKVPISELIIDDAIIKPQEEETENFDLRKSSNAILKRKLSLEESNNKRIALEKTHNPSNSSSVEETSAESSSMAASTSSSQDDSISSKQKEKNPWAMNECQDSSKIFKNKSITERETQLLQFLDSNNDSSLDKKITVSQIQSLTPASLSDAFVNPKWTNMLLIQRFFEEEAFQLMMVKLKQKKTKRLFTCPLCEKNETEVKGNVLVCSGCLMRHHYECLGIKRKTRGDWLCDKCIQS